MNNLNTKLKTPELIRRKFTVHVLPSAWHIGLKLAVNTMLPRVSCEVANEELLMKRSLISLTVNP